jgi:hypothetical protein
MTVEFVEGAQARRTLETAPDFADPAACAAVAAKTDVPARVNVAAMARSTLRAAFERTKNRDNEPLLSGNFLIVPPTDPDQCRHAR